MSVQNVSMTAPTDYTADQMAIERRRKLSEAMQAQSMQPMESQTAGGWVIPTSPWQGAAKLAQALGGAYGQHKADESERALAAKYRQELVDTVTNAERARLGTPGSPQPAAEQGGGPAQPASPANAQLANALLLNHPATQGLGLQGMQRDMQTQAFIQAGQGGQQPAPVTSQGTQVASLAPTGVLPAGQPPAQPQAPTGAPAGFGGPAGGSSMAVWLQSDPTGKSYLEALSKDYSEGQKPVVNRGFGLGRMVNGKYVPDQASLDQALNLERGKEGIKSEFELVPGMTDDQGRPVYRSKASVLHPPAQQAPASPLPANVPEADRAAYEAVASGKIPAAYGNRPAPVIGQTTAGKASQAEAGRMGPELQKHIDDEAQHAVEQKRILGEMSQLFQDFSPSAVAPARKKLLEMSQALGYPLDQKQLDQVSSMQGIAKLNAQLATSAMKQFTNRGTQMEFKTFLQNNPGIEMTPQGAATIIQFMSKGADIAIQKQQEFVQWKNTHPADNWQDFNAVWNKKLNEGMGATLSDKTANLKGIVNSNDSDPLGIRAVNR